MIKKIIVLSSYIYRASKGECPKCFTSGMFQSYYKMKKSCSNCGISFIENNGDNWFFLLIIDRALFIFPIVFAFYLEINPRAIIFLAIFLLFTFIIITPVRLGICLGFDFYFRSRIIKK